MSLPWLQEPDPAELLPDDTKWEEHDELTLWKQCKLRGMEAWVKKRGDALRTLNELKNLEVKWLCCPIVAEINGISLPHEMAVEKAFASFINFTGKQTIQVLRIEECEVPNSFGPEMVIEMSDATVRIGRNKACSCGSEFDVGFTFTTCPHILYLERNVLKCPEHLQRVDRLEDSQWKEYFANAPLAFRPQKLAKGQALKHTITDKECQLCFKETENSGGIVKCRACQRVAHQQCHDIYRMRKAPCEGDTGCPLCCPQCPWNPINRELKVELHPLEMKEEPGVSREKSETIGDVPLTGMARRNRMLEKKMRKLQRQLRRKPVSRAMSALRYERLAGRIGRKGATYRRNKLAVVVKNALKSEDARPKDEDKAVVFKEEVESPVKIIKVEKTKKVKSEPVIISLL